MVLAGCASGAWPGVFVGCMGFGYLGVGQQLVFSPGGDLVGCGPCNRSHATHFPLKNLLFKPLIVGGPDIFNTFIQSCFVIYDT